MALPYVSIALGLAQLAPGIAKLLAGEKGEQVAQEVVDIARKITGLEEDVGMIKYLKENPEMLIAFQREVIRLETDIALTDLQDRQNARFRDIQFLSSGRHNIRADIMVISSAGGLIACLCSLINYGEYMPGEAVGIISTISGIFGSCLKDAYAFEFGSSRSSKVKDNAVAALLERTGN